MSLQRDPIIFSPGVRRDIMTLQQDPSLLWVFSQIFILVDLRGLFIYLGGPLCDLVISHPATISWYDPSELAG